MSQNLLLENIISIDGFFAIPGRAKKLQKNIVENQKQGFIYKYDTQSQDNIVLSTNDNDKNKPKSLAVDNHCEIVTGAGHDVIFGKALSSAISSANASSQGKLISDYVVTANSQTKADVSVLALGISNLGQINTGRGNDIIFGLADASGTSIADSQAESIISNATVTDANSSSGAKVSAVVNAVGINNAGNINTGTGYDIIVGIGNAAASATAQTKSQAKLASGDKSQTTANSESLAIVSSIAIGIDNSSVINTGEGNDIIIGLATNTAMSKAEATALASSTATLATGLDSQANSIKTALSGSTATATAVSALTSLGIINSGQILTGNGNDVIIGIANSQNSSQSKTTSGADSTAKDTAEAKANSQSLAIAENSTVGIVNQGQINTGKGNDIVVGISINSGSAKADADGNAVAIADNSNTKPNTSSIADASKVITMGIDNTGGTILTGDGNDQVIGIGGIGIAGGTLSTGSGDDKVTGYGKTVGIQDSQIKLDQGNDYFKAAIANFDPLTGAVSFSSDQANSIKNTSVFGDLGNDTFEIGGFKGNVLIDGGKDFDILRLSGSHDKYKFTTSADHQTLTIEDSGSILTVQNVEAIYYGGNEQVYTISDFA